MATGNFSLSASKPLYGTLRLAQHQFHIFSLCMLGFQNTYPDTKRWPWPLYVASKHMCVEMRDKRTAPAFHNYPRSLNLDADVPDLERREKHNRTALKEEKAPGLNTGTFGNLKYTGKK